MRTTKSNRTSQFLLLAIIAATISIGCRHPLVIVGNGDILSSSGNRDCLLEEYQTAAKNCTENKVTANNYHQTYYATPRSGWQFNGWGNYCIESSLSAAECDFKVSKDLVELAPEWTAPPLTAFFRREVTQSYAALFMGHSFFIPLVPWFDAIAKGAGFSDHEVSTVQAGNTAGAAISLWEDGGSNNADIKAIMDDGGLSLIGMTYAGLPYEDELRGYSNWVEYALQNNPEAAFLIAIPWDIYPGDVSTEEYANSWHDYHALTHNFIDELRNEFPGTNFYCVPHGHAATELRQLFDTDSLPEIEALISGEGQNVENSGINGIHSDALGHADEVMFELGALIMLGSIYGIDLADFPYQNLSGFTTKFPATDLGAIAAKILSTHDHNYDST